MTYQLSPQTRKSLDFKKTFVFSSGATIPTPSQNGVGIFFAKFSRDPAAFELNFFSHLAIAGSCAAGAGTPVMFAQSRLVLSSMSFLQL